MTNKKVAILLVDDEVIILVALKYQLEAFLSDDIRVEIAASATELHDVLAEFQKEEYSLAALITDFTMPDISGADVLELVHATYPAASKALLTGQCDREILSRLASEYQLKEVFDKPWNSNAVKQFVHDAVAAVA